jgi:hypothetical protein
MTAAARGQRNMNVEMTLETNAQFAECGKPGMCTLDDQAMPSRSLLVFYTSAGDTNRDSALLQVAPAQAKFIAGTAASALPTTVLLSLKLLQ